MLSKTAANVPNWNRISYLLSVVFMLICTLTSITAYSQHTTILDTSNKGYATIVAGKQYKRGGLHNMFWGNHYRDEWSMPVKVKVVQLDTVFGGLKPILKGGGRQTRTLRLQNAKGKQYVLRSIDKTFTKALPPEFQHTFVESVANDQVSISHPYSAVTVPILAQAAKVFHTNPEIVFIGNDPALGAYREEFANQLYLLEERPAGFEGDAENFGNSEDVDGTEKMMRKVMEENDHRVDQEAFVRARLFDMFLSDWGRHEDQWRWATFKEDGIRVYRPIPRDRDQAFTRFDGALVAFGIKAARLTYLQSVDYTIKDVGGYNFQARHLDRFLANEPPQQTWIVIAQDLQQRLTDSVIDNAMQKLPPEVYATSGKLISDKLKARRDKLVDFATKYYQMLAREVDIVGTKQREVFEVNGINNNEIRVNVYDQNAEGTKKGKAFYSRTFYANETKEVRLYAIDGRDKFVVSGNAGNSIKIRLIGSPKKDTYTVDPSFGNKVRIYDDNENEITTNANVKLHLSSDSAIHAYNYGAYKSDYSGLKSGLSYSNEDRLYIGLNFQIQKQKWRKTPFASQQDLFVNYSITQKAFSAKYKGVFNQALGQWNLGVLADYDAVRDGHFPGIGNNTIKASDDRDFYLYKDKEFNASLTVFRTFSERHTLSFSGFYQAIQLLKDNSKYIIENPVMNNPSMFEKRNFAGVTAEYNFQNIREKLFPVTGVRFSTGAGFTQNSKETSKNVVRFYGMAGTYLPIASNVSLAIKVGAETVTGEPEFYQLSKLGGGNTLRGYLRYRFYGKTALYNQNELQWNFNFKSYLFNGKMGLVALFDNGRVWQPGESLNKWHIGYGGGITLAPFNKISLTGTYAVSPEHGRFNVRIGRLF